MTPRRSLFGPVILILVGVVFLLVNAGKLPFRAVAELFAQYWPVLLILWGVVRLLEHLHARNQNEPTPRMGAGTVFLLVLIVMVGISFTGFTRLVGGVDRWELQDKLEINDNDFGMFFGKRYEFTENLEQTLPAGASLKVVVERGSVTVKESADNKVRVLIRKTVIGDSESDAQRVHELAKPTLAMQDGNVMYLNAEGRSDWRNARLDMEIQAPRKAALEIMTLRGDVDVRGRDGDVKAHASRGSVILDEVNGSAEVHLRRGDLTATRVNGDVRFDGQRVGDVTAQDVTGLVALNAEIFGDIKLGKIGKGARFQSARTSMETGPILGRMDMGGGEMRSSDIVGGVRVQTRSKDIHLDRVSGDVTLETSNAEVEVRPDPKAALSNIDVNVTRGSIRVYLPASSGFQLDAAARRGEIETDFDLPRASTGEDRDNRVSGTVGKGGPRVSLRTERGRISVMKQ